jgi:hypothetical protein
MDEHKYSDEDLVSKDKLLGYYEHGEFHRIARIIENYGWTRLYAADDGGGFWYNNRNTGYNFSDTRPSYEEEKDEFTA